MVPRSPTARKRLPSQTTERSWSGKEVFQGADLHDNPSGEAVIAGPPPTPTPTATSRSSDRASRRNADAAPADPAVQAFASTEVSRTPESPTPISRPEKGIRSNSRFVPAFGTSRADQVRPSLEKMITSSAASDRAA